MSGEAIPSAAASFLGRCVTSLADLEVLVVLMAFRERWFDTASIGAQAGLTPGEARRALDRFVSANVVDIRATDDVRYQFRPGTVELEAGARAVREIYQGRPAAVVRWLARRSLRRAADVG
jgi:hypothetical protein